MNLKINAAPSNFTLDFCDLRRLSEKDHKEAFTNAVQKFVQAVEILTSGDAEIFIPQNIRLGLKENSWNKISTTSQNLNNFSNYLYELENYEFCTELRYLNEYYKILFCSDPVYFSLKK